MIGRKARAGTRTASEHEWQSFQDDAMHVYVMCMAKRPGSYLFLTRLEFDYYNPAGPREPLYKLIEVEWPDDGPARHFDTIHVVQIPVAEKPLAVKVAKTVNMRLSPGVMQGVWLPGPGPGGFVIGTARDATKMLRWAGDTPGVVGYWFPLRGPNVYALEGDVGYPRNGDWLDVMRREYAEADRIRQRHRERLESQRKGRPIAV